MKNLNYFLTENLIVEGKNDKIALRKLLLSYCKNRPNIVFPNNVDKSRHNKVIANIDFNMDESEIRSTVEAAFQSHIENGTLTLGKYEVFGRDAGTSGTYKSLEVFLDGETYYVVNSASKNLEGSSLLKSKDICPDKLGLALPDKVYNGKELMNKALAAVKSVTEAKNAENVYLLCKNLSEMILNGDGIKTNGSFSSKSVEDFFSSNEEGTCEFSISNDMKEIISNVAEGDIGNIEKDYGEVLGPLLFAGLFGDVEISFPTCSNEPMLDYYINGFKVSAKQLGGGGKPSGSALLTAANKKRKEIQKDGLSDLDDKSPREKKALYTPEEIDFIDKVASTYDLSASGQQMSLIQTFVFDNNKELSSMIGFNLNDIESKNYKELVSRLDAKFETEDIEKFFEEYYRILNYKSLKEWTPSKVASDWKKTSEKVKAGIFLYPAWAVAINEINNRYGKEDNDIISTVLQKEIEMKQVYFGIRKNSMKLLVVSAGASKWKFTTGGMSTNNPNNSRLAITIKH